jgi:hypothetical protein
VHQCDVVIVNYNTGGFLRDAVGSVLLPAVAHIVIVDNASTDNSLDLASQFHDERLQIIRNPANLGFAAACNIGIERTTADNILLLNPDCRVISGGIERLLAALRSADRIGMVGPLLLNPDGSEQVSGRRRFPMPRIVLAKFFDAIGIRRLFASSGDDTREQSLPSVPSKVEAISGACMMVRREAIADVGLLEESYFLHFEDLDWCFRFALNGWITWFVPDATVIHTKGVSSRQHPFAVEYYKHRGMNRFYQNFRNDSCPYWLRVIVVGAVWVRFAAVMLWRLIRFARFSSRDHRA